MIFKNNNPFALSIIASHGITDLVLKFNDLNMWKTYSAITLLSVLIPQKILFLVFLYAGWIHFSNDLGQSLSFQLTTLVPSLIWNWVNLSLAVNYMMHYMIYIHVPLHYLKLKNLLIAMKYRTSIVLLISHIITYQYFKNKPEDWFLKLDDLTLRLFMGVIMSHVLVNYS